jgi:hypothetical protein
MKLDERAQRAAVDLLERAERRPVPTVDDVVRPQRRTGPGRRGPSRRVLAVAAAVAVLAGGAAVFASRERPLPRVDPPMASIPAGLTPQVVVPDGAGVSFQLPSTWTRSTSNDGHNVVYVGDGGQAYVSVGRIATVEDLDTDELADLRHDVIAARVDDAEIGDASRTTIDGHDAIVRELRADPDTATEYSIDLDDGTWASVVLGEYLPVEQTDVMEWIASTIEVEPAPLWSSSIEHPASLPMPEGVTPRTWSPDGLGVSIERPDGWQETRRGASGFDFGTMSTVGPDTWVLASRVTHALGNAENRQVILERQFGVEELVRIDTEVEGHPASISRYRFPHFDEPRLAALDVEYVIDMGDGTFVWLAIGTNGGTPAELIEWMRSTIRVTE